MNVFLLHAGDFSYLPYQAAACRKHLPSDASLIVVQGPFGGRGDSPLRLSAAGAEELGVCIHEITARLAGGPYARQEAIVGELLAAAGPDETRLILQGDCLPSANLTAETLLDGHQAAGRGFVHEGKARLGYNWVCARGPARLAGGSLAGMKCYGATVLDQDLHIERCLPGFLHLDKIGRGDRVSEKLKWLTALYGELPPPLLTDRDDTPPPLALNILSTPEATRREGICRECDRWDRTRDGCALLKKCERHRLTRALWRRHSPQGCRLERWLPPLNTAPRPACATCDPADPLPDPPRWSPKSWAFSEDVRRRHTAALAEVCGREPTPPADLGGDGIVYAGDGRYWPMIVIGVRLLREVGCTLPVKVFTRGQEGRELAGCDVDLIDLDEFERSHPVRCNTAYSVKSYAMTHCGLARALWLDADAYCVADPTPLFAVLDDSPFVFWATGNNYYPTYDTHWTGIPQDSGGMEVQGGQYLIDFRRYWPELQIARWIDDHADYFWRHNKYHDEAAWRLALASRGSPFLKLAYRWAGSVMVSGWRGTDYICHRIRPATKLVLGGTPRRSRQAPSEARVFELFAELDPGYPRRFHRWVEGERAARAPKMLRARRQAELAGRGRR